MVGVAYEILCLSTALCEIVEGSANVSAYVRLAEVLVPNFVRWSENGVANRRLSSAANESCRLWSGMMVSAENAVVLSSASVKATVFCSFVVNELRPW